jgi:cytochrome P450
MRAQLIAEVAPDYEFRERVSILNLDPPDHTRLRKLVSSVFTPRRIAELQPMIAGVVERHLDAAEARGEMDLIADLAFPLPFTVISEMMGMPTEDRPGRTSRRTAGGREHADASRRGHRVEATQSR